VFKRKVAINQQHEFIAQSAQELVPKIGDKASWVSPLLGRFTLLNLDIKKSKVVKPPYYELRAGLRVNPSIDRFPLELYMFNGTGLVLGVVHNLAHAQFTNEAAEEFVSATNFQIDNGLTAPNQEDYDKLGLYLKNGKMDKV
jgi:hypothetical protein